MSRFYPNRQSTTKGLVVAALTWKPSCRGPTARREGRLLHRRLEGATGLRVATEAATVCQKVPPAFENVLEYGVDAFVVHHSIEQRSLFLINVSDLREFSNADSCRVS
jgi:hypothetical protein